MGKQKRIRTCFKSSECNNEQNCFVPCLKQNLLTSTSSQTLSKSNGTYSDWTNWSACRSSDCTSTRTRQCLQEPCPDNLIESQPCKGNFCPSKKIIEIIRLCQSFRL